MNNEKQVLPEELISFRDFSFQYNAQSEPTLRDITFSVRKGEKVLILGPSGCGKSTMIHCINGLIPFSNGGTVSGSLKVGGQETSELGIFELSKTVGTVLQDTDGQFVGLTVAEDLAFALENDCVQDPALHNRVRDIAVLVRMEDHLRHAPQELSGGQKQRVSLGGVLADDVSVLLFDEPLANLDPMTGTRTIELIDEMQKQTGAAVIIVEHRLEDVLWRSVDRIVLMEKGRIISDTSPDELLSSDLLQKCGIREPLYLTALKNAGIQIRPEHRPWSIRTIRLSEEEKSTAGNYYRNLPNETRAKEHEVLLSAEHITFSYPNGKKALDDVSLQIRKGEMLAIVGTNGAGKTTFSKVLCGFLKEQEGMLALHGEDMSGLTIRERADHIGYVLQNPNQMISKVQIMDEAAFGLTVRNTAEEEKNARVENALRVCGLWSFRNWPVSALSFGQKKRLTVASILSLDPEILILDEPTAGQDYRHYTEIMTFLSSLCAQGIAVVMITHDMHLMLEYADRAAVFDNARLLRVGSPADILTDREVISRASLKETSLYALSGILGMENGSAFSQCFIEDERRRRRDEKSV